MGFLTSFRQIFASLFATPADSSLTLFMLEIMVVLEKKTQLFLEKCNPWHAFSEKYKNKLEF